MRQVIPRKKRKGQSAVRLKRKMRKVIGQSVARLKRKRRRVRGQSAKKWITSTSITGHIRSRHGNTGVPDHNLNL